MTILVHYHEIALKGKNRAFFENKLIENIKLAIPNATVKRQYGRILVELKNANIEASLIASLQNIFGISNFSFAHKTDLDIEKIKKTSLEIIKDKNFQTFRITTKRSNKNFPLTSMEVDRQVGEHIFESLKNKKVKLKNHDLECFIEITEKQALIYTKKIKGPGGLPIGVSGKGVCLLSGGIDSPVAAYRIMKRGMKIIFVHFHSYPYTDKASIEKVESLKKILENFQPNSKLITIPFAEIQKQIVAQVPDKYRIIFYRRFMLRLAEEIAKEKKAKCLITGESLGQVASQTIENISVIGQAVSMPILRPLIGYDKEEIIAQAKKINTFETSILPHNDCCNFLMPHQPETKARIKDILQIEEKLNIKTK